MPKRTDTLLVIDLEATCWDGPPPPGQESEVIEIGVCVVDVAACERRERESILVRPRLSTVSPFCTELTTLTPAQVAEGVSFAEACALLRSRFRARERVWASYGEYDRRQMERQCARDEAPYPFDARHLNVKTLLALALGLPLDVGMREALEHLGLPLEGTHHRGGDDAWNIAGILVELLRRVRR